MLYFVATPIGNLQDMSFRAIETLKRCDYILCEDTRHSLPLLQYYAIEKPLKSFHQFNEATKESSIVSDLKEGKEIGLISDAGFPGIADPGIRLAQTCAQENLPFTVIPGACAALIALVGSGFSSERFQFYGFLPRKTEELKRALQEILIYPAVTVCYESPKRIVAVLEVLERLAPSRPLAIGRELTKKFEEFSRGTAEELRKKFEASEPRGEFVLVVDGKKEPTTEWLSLSAQEHVSYLEQTYGLSKGEAIKLAAQLRGVPKRDVYNRLLP